MASSRCPSNLQTRTFTAGTIVQIFYALFLPAVSLNQLTPSFYKILDGKKAAARIYSIIDRVPAIRSEDNAIIPEAFFGKIEFIDVSFAYPKEKKNIILNKINFTIDCKHSAFIG